MGKRKAEDDEWELFKDEILMHYAENPLPRVIEIMGDKGFKRTKAQYERRLKGWQDGAHKNVTKAEWKYITQQIQYRKTEGKSSEVRVRGYTVPPSTIKKQSPKHTYQTALERYAPKIQATTPPGVEVYTPCERSLSPGLLTSEMRFNFRIMMQLPWQCFNNQFDHHIRLHREVFNPMSLDDLALIQECGSKSNDYRSVSFQFTSGGSMPSRDSLSAFREMSLVASAAALSNSTQYLPIDLDFPETSRKSNFDLTVNGNQLDLLKCIVGLIANNYFDSTTYRTLDQFVENPHNLAFLGRLLSMDQVSTNAFAEKLLLSTIDLGVNAPLAKILLDFGADPNYIDSDGRSLLGMVSWKKSTIIPQLLLAAGADVNYQDTHGRTPLMTACRFGNDALVELLLEYGADVNSQDLQERSPLWLAICNCSDTIISRLLDHGAKLGVYDIFPLNCIVDNCSFNTAMRLFKAKPTSQYWPAITVGTFIDAAWKGDIGIFTLLESLQPGLFAMLRQTPWTLFEPAAFGTVEKPISNAIAIMNYLRSKGFDITAVDQSGRGSPLVYAILCGSIDMTKYLLESGAQIDSYAIGRWMYAKDCTSYYDKLMSLIKRDHVREALLFDTAQEVGAIHAVAICVAEPDVKVKITSLLLNYGANPNQPGVAFPIQIASWTDGKGAQLVKMLLQAGANINFRNPRQLNIQRRKMEEHKPARWSWTFLLGDPFPSAFQMCFKRGRLGVIKQLCRAGALLPHSDVMEYHHFGDDWASMSTLWDNGWSLDDPIFSDELRYGCQTWNTESGDGRCPFSCEHWSNPVLGVIHEGGEKLFEELSAMLSPAQRTRWITRKCLSAFPKTFEWRFVTHHITSGTLLEPFLISEELLLKAISERDVRWVYRLIRKECLPWDTVQRGFLVATNLDLLDLIPLFLEAGYWPDTQVRFSHTGDEIIYEFVDYDSPLGCALSNGQSDTIAVFEKFYGAKLYETHNSNISHHFTQAYAEAIRNGQIEFAKSLMREENLGNLESTCLFPDEGDLRFNIGINEVVSFHSSVQLAVASEQYDTARWLLGEGADPNVSKEGQNSRTAYHSPLQCAAREGKIELVRTLIGAGANVNDTPMSFRGATALQFAAIEGNFDVMNALLEAGANVNAPPCFLEGRSAVEGAAEWGRLDAVCFLLELGADIRGRMNVNYRKTVYRAWVHGHRVLARMIQRWKEEKYGAEDCELTESIVESMDLETLEQHGESNLTRPEDFKSCETCKKSCRREYKRESSDYDTCSSSTTSLWGP